MAVKYFLDAPDKDGLSIIRIRVQNRVPKVDVKQKTPIRVKPSVWNFDKNDPKFEKLKQNPDVKKIFDDTDEIRSIIDGLLSTGKSLGAQDVHEIVEGVVYREIHDQQKAAEEEAARKEAEAKRMTLAVFRGVVTDDLDGVLVGADCTV